MQWPKRLSIFNSRKFRTNLHGLSRAVNVLSTGRWVLFCVLVGIAAGLMAVLFNYLLDLVHTFALEQTAGVPIPMEGQSEYSSDQLQLFSSIFTPFSRPLIIILPAIGGLLSGILVYKFAPEAEGQGTGAVIKSFHERKGVIKPLVPVVKLVASVLTIGSGGSAGKEGPLAQIGAGIGSYIGTKLKLSENERKLLMLAGMGAGIGAIFKAPIGGAIFSTEVLYRKDMESEGLMTSIIASIVGYSVYASIYGWESVFMFKSIQFQNALELPLFILLSVLLMIAGIVYSKLLHGPRRWIFDKISVPRYIKPAIGGLMVGVMGFFFPAIIGSSYGYLQAALNGQLTISFMLVLALLKTFSTSFTTQSGGSGGVFAPSLVIGGLIGGAFGYGMQLLFPGLSLAPEAYVLVGMGSFFAAAANVPIAATIMISEMSQSYGLIVPLLFASAIAFIGAQSWSIYDEQLPDRMASKAHRGEFLNEVLEKLKVRSAYRRIKDMPSINIRDNVQDILDLFTQAEALVLPVKNDDGQPVGIISLYDVRALLSQEPNSVIIAADIMYPPQFLHLNDPMSKAFEYFIQSGEPEIPILKHGSETEFIGVLSERNFLIAYEKEVKLQE